MQILNYQPEWLKHASECPFATTSHNPNPINNILLQFSFSIIRIQSITKKKTKIKDITKSKPSRYFEKKNPTHNNLYKQQFI